MTEKQGGSDVRANRTRAEPDGDGWRLFGHKWFCSAPMSDAFLTLAQAPGGLTCFLVPRWTPDGERNPIQLMRLKDKLGNRANASAEIEYRGAWARRLGGEGDGVRTIIEMVHHTRLDTAMAPAGLMRAALSEALWWCANRAVFGRRLVDQPLMASVLADLALEVEAATALGLRVAQAFDEGDRAFARIGVALAKFLNNKRCPQTVYEAMECLGGVGYVEEGPMPLLYREAPLNSIWEGSGNVICLDVLRSLARDPEARARLDAELDAGRGRDPGYDAGLDALARRWPDAVPEAEARWFVERLATLLAGAVLLRSGAEPVAEAYVASRVAGEGGRVAGSPAGAAGPARADRAGDAVLRRGLGLGLALVAAGCGRVDLPEVAIPGSGKPGPAAAGGGPGLDRHRRERRARDAARLPVRWHPGDDELRRALPAGAVALGRGRASGLGGRRRGAARRGGPGRAPDRWSSRSRSAARRSPQSYRAAEPPEVCPDLPR